MFASQLLRILQTLPADVKYESCDFDTAELKVKIKENQRHSDSYRDEHDSSSFTTKQSRRSNGGDDFWNTPELEHSQVVDDFTKESEIDIRVSKERDKLWNTPELESSMIINDFAKSNLREKTRDTRALVITSSKFQEDYTDKNVMECDLPELMVCYKEINYHVVKDICIDEGIPLDEKGLTDEHDEPTDEYEQNEASGGDLDFALLIPDGSKASLEEEIDDTKEDGDISSEASVEESESTPRVNENYVIEEEDSIIISMLPLKTFGTRSFLRSFMDSLKDDGNQVTERLNQMDSVEENLESLVAESKAEESNKTGSANKLAYNSKIENEAITFDFNSPKTEVVNRWGTKAEPVEQALKSDDSPNHKNGNIRNPLESNLVQHTSNPFIGSEVQSTRVDGITENIHQESTLNPKKVNSNNPFASGELQIPVPNDKKGEFNPFVFSEIETSSIYTNTKNIHQPPMLNAKNPFAVSEVQNASKDDSSQQSVVNHKIETGTNPFFISDVQSSSIGGTMAKTGNSNNPFAMKELRSDIINVSINEVPNHGTEKIQRASTIPEDSEIVHDQSLEPRDSPSSKDVNGTANSIPLTDQGQVSEGEMSFSMADPVTGLITYAGPITHSASTSLRSSDSSTTSTSTRSFAFPVLPSEWNSSPERMGKADRRKGWKRGAWRWRALCCSGRLIR